MKHNEFLNAALLYGIITVFGSILSVFNIPAICTTHRLITEGIDNSHLKLNSKLLYTTKTIYIISIIMTIITTLIYLYICI
ncbi:MAG: hypothetical protein U0L85_06445 [Bacilli bacterium]|nr:hypothetical protein [Bacilli bacterium]